MELLSRYIVKIFLRNFALSLGSFVGVYLLVDFFEKVDNFVEKSAPAKLYLGYFLNAIPLFVTQVAPLAVLMAAFITIGSLSRTGELTAMRAGGLSLYRIARPIILTTCVITVLLIINQEFILPGSTGTMNRIMKEEVKGISHPQRIRNQIWVRDGNSIVHIEQVIPNEGVLQGITFFELDENFRIIARTDAGSGQYADSGWQFRNIKRRLFNPGDGEMVSASLARRESLPFNKKPADFRQDDPHEWELNFLDLRTLATRMQDDGYDATRYLVNMHAHIASPFACLVMVLLGIPFALNRGRNTSLALGIVISVLVGVAYFMLHSIATAFGYSGVLPPLLATWSANILIGLTGLWLVLFRPQ